MRAKKSLGQNFLKDPKILKKIADFAEITKEDVVVEVGPGEGALTEQLLKQAKKVVAIEKDEELSRLLRLKFEREIADGRLEIIVGDILNYELRIMNYVLVGNIPYYITGALFKKFLESEDQPFDSAQGKPKSITFVVQKEVADRILARDGKESILSISVKAYGKPEFGGIIKAGSFYPKPKVDSAILAVRNVSKEKFEISPPTPSLPRRQGGVILRGELEKKFFEILKAGFAHKRKLLIKNLEKLATKEDLAKTFEKCGLSSKIRAEDLKTGDWLALTQKLS